jgi:hypothetical protein
MFFAGMALLLTIQLWPPGDLFFPGKVGSLTGFSNWYAVTKGVMYFVFAEKTPVFITILVISLWWFYKKRVLHIFLLPLLLLTVFVSSVLMRPWHEGIFFLLWIFVLWLSLDKRAVTENDALTLWSRRAVLTGLTIVLLFQVRWSFVVSMNDFYNSYSGSYELAEYIKKNGYRDKKIMAMGYASIAVLPYFKNNILLNHNNGKKPSYCLWTQEFMDENSPMTCVDLGKEPALFIRELNPDIKYERWNIPGYEYVRGFIGKMYWKDRVQQYLDTFEIYVKKE